MKELRRLLKVKRRELARLTRQVSALERCLAEMGDDREVVPRPDIVPADPEKHRRNEEARARISAAAKERWDALQKKTTKRRRALARLHQ
jgi:hypothetical protein